MNQFKNSKCIIYTGHEIDDLDTFNMLPKYIRDFYIKNNGFILGNGVVHIRGCVKKPIWHSLKEIWYGKDKLSNLYDSIQLNDIPIAQDCFGDQFFLRNNTMYLLKSEFDEIETFNCDFLEFMEQIYDLTPEEIDLKNSHGIKLKPGQLINVDPPLVFDSPIGYSFKAIKAIDQIKNLSKLSKILKKRIDKELINTNPN